MHCARCILVQGSAFLTRWGLAGFSVPGEPPQGWATLQTVCGAEVRRGDPQAPRAAAWMKRKTGERLAAAAAAQTLPVQPPLPLPRPQKLEPSVSSGLTPVPSPALPIPAASGSSEVVRLLKTLTSQVASLHQSMCSIQDMLTSQVGCTVPRPFPVFTCGTASTWDAFAGTPLACVGESFGGKD
jgi:hypothetical protein